jgi:hypothetical protein
MCELSSVAISSSILYFVGPRDPPGLNKVLHTDANLEHHTSNRVLQHAGKYGIGFSTVTRN